MKLPIAFAIVALCLSAQCLAIDLRQLIQQQQTPKNAQDADPRGNRVYFDSKSALLNAVKYSEGIFAPGDHIRLIEPRTGGVALVSTHGEDVVPSVVVILRKEYNVECETNEGLSDLIGASTDRALNHYRDTGGQMSKGLAKLSKEGQTCGTQYVAAVKAFAVEYDDAMKVREDQAMAAKELNQADIVAKQQKKDTCMKSPEHAQTQDAQEIRMYQLSIAISNVKLQHDKQVEQASGVIDLKVRHDAGEVLASAPYALKEAFAKYKRDGGTATSVATLMDAMPTDPCGG